MRRKQPTPYRQACGRPCSVSPRSWRPLCTGVSKASNRRDGVRLMSATSREPFPHVIPLPVLPHSGRQAMHHASLWPATVHFQGSAMCMASVVKKVLGVRRLMVAQRNQA